MDKIGVELFVQAGCSSCLRAKEFLRTSGVEFVLRDISADPAALAVLQARGVSTVPVVFVGDSYCFAQDVGVVARFLGISRAHSSLDPPTLLDRYVLGLDVAGEIVKQVPPELFDVRAIEPRERSVGFLGRHIFDIADRFLAGVATGRWQKARDTVPPGLDTAGAVAAYGANVRDRIDAYRARAGEHDFGALIETYYGRPTAHYLLERSVWHSVQHTRQLSDLVKGQGITPARVIDERLTAGLPLPAAVWE